MHISSKLLYFISTLLYQEKKTHHNLPGKKQKKAYKMSRRMVFWHCVCCYIHVTVWTTQVGRAWTHKRNTSNNHWKTIM